ncbi:MAG: ligase-associated DNA damage response DEXH box helicase [Hyphomicrobiaceae bacterium]
MPVKAAAKSKPRRRRAPAKVAQLPAPIATWFKARGWSPRPHQVALLEKARAHRDTLLIAPTGAGKTLAGFLPTLIDLLSDDWRAQDGHRQELHTLYISPLKALAVDIARNLTGPVDEMDLDITIETRSADTSTAKRARQRTKPPNILLTTPEQIALLLAHEDAPRLFSTLKTVILDELHALVASKRGDLLALNVARLRKLAPGVRVTGLSATVARPSELRAYLACQDAPSSHFVLADLVETGGGVEPDIIILEGDDPLPWSGHTARYAVGAMYQAIKAHRLSLLFVNTRSQAEMLFHELWRINEDTLPIALHHGSLDAGQRRKVEAAMAAGKLKAVVATSTLDLGIDWGDIDLVINVGAPKGASRLLQRIGRANHRLDEPSKALLVPSNRFEVLECRAALEAARAGSQDAVLNRTGTLDVLAQHVMATACGSPFHAQELFDEVRTAAPYTTLDRDTFERVIDFVATGGYALRAYERHARLRQQDNGAWRLAHPRLAQQHRLNSGTIVEAPKIKIRLVRARGKSGVSRKQAFRGGKVLGELDEYFVGELKFGDTFVFSGQILRFEGMFETEAFVTRTTDSNPAIPSYPGGKFPLSTHLAVRVRAMLEDRSRWQDLPSPVYDWLRLQDEKSLLPDSSGLLVETFPRRDKHYLVAYPFEGRLAHQTLGMLLTRRLQRARALPLGFVANDYGIAIWCGRDIGSRLRDGLIDLAELFEEDMLGDDLDAWLSESSLMKRTFRACAIISGLIERRHPGKEKSGRQMTASSDLIYDVLRQHDPDHILLQAAWADTATGLLDIRRLGDFLKRIRGRIRHASLERVSPLAVPLLLEIGAERVHGNTADELMRDAVDLLEEI